MSLLPYKVFLNKLKGNGIVFFDKNSVYVQGLENEQVLLFQSKLEKPLFERPTKIKYIKKTIDSKYLNIWPAGHVDGLVVFYYKYKIGSCRSNFKLR
jgi:hypothetical protein